MKPTIPALWRRSLRRLARLLKAPRRGPVPLAARPPDGDWATRSALGEEDPGASVDLLDSRPPPRRLKGDGPPRA